MTAKRATKDADIYVYLWNVDNYFGCLERFVSKAGGVWVGVVVFTALCLQIPTFQVARRVQTSQKMALQALDLLSGALPCKLQHFRRVRAAIPCKLQYVRDP